MRIEVDSFSIPRRDFYDLRRELTTANKKFDEVNLKLIPYDQLFLCCIGNAGTALCSPKLVQDEMTRRRERFLNMELEELASAENFLKREKMYDDVVRALLSRSLPKWNDLKVRQQVWVKLTCLYNHVNDPGQRISEALHLLKRCTVVTLNDGLPTDYCMALMSKLKGVGTVYPGKLSDEIFRDKIKTMANGLLEFLPDCERAVLVKEQLQDYSCTSNCFRVLV